MHDPTVETASTGPVFAGVDWVSADHAVCVVDAAGTVRWRHTVSHSRAGLTRLTTRLAELGVTRVGSTPTCSPTRCAPTVTGSPA